MRNTDYLSILLALEELPFNVGKRTLVELLTGAVSKKMVSNDTYMEMNAYGSLDMYSEKEVSAWIEKLVSGGYIAVITHQTNAYWKLLAITQKGREERANPALLDNMLRPQFTPDKTGDQSKQLMESFGFFLETFNAEQQHAIVCPAPNIRCVAGAGTGKTTVLTKRIEFLVKHRGIPAKNILAITFTRKARAEMQKRLAGIDVHVSTFNGLCERILRARGVTKQVPRYGEKIRFFQRAVQDMGLDMKGLIFEYFTTHQRSGSTHDELMRRLMNDVYSILDHYSNEDSEVPEKGLSALATTLLQLAKRVQTSMDEHGLRDYSGQLKECLALLRENPSWVPRFDHILVDEYQDVNKAQQELLSLLSPPNLFVVGDPRQSIFGWRGSHVEYILEFPADVTVQLRKNYRSTTQIITLMNTLIKRMELPDLKASMDENGVVQVMKYDTEDAEIHGIAALLKGANHEDIFVLARTNKQLTELSHVLRGLGIAHHIKSEGEEENKPGITLATAHAIKGLEAKSVIVMGCTSRHFPCKVSDHPVIDLIKDNTIDKEEEELRLLYVAVSRAKEQLIITHTGSPTYLLDGALGGQQKLVPQARDDSSYERLRTWRTREAASRGVPPYVIASDKTLREISDTKPQTVHELGHVYGMGPAKISKYGEELLDVLHEQ